jgi:hypothetical protein
VIPDPPLAAALEQHLERSIVLYSDLVRDLPEPALAMRLPAGRSNSIGGQLWCVIGARESYARAIEAGKWAGFTCSLDAGGALRRESVRSALSHSADAVRGAVSGLGAFDAVRARLALDLLEHEAAHHGQLIRYLYALGLAIPDSWKARYALE